MTAKSSTKPESSSGATTRDEAEILGLMRIWETALKSHDLSVLPDLYSPDIVFYNTALPSQVVGISAYQTWWKGCLPHMPKKFNFLRHGTKVVVSGDAAFVYGLAAMQVEGETELAGCTWVRVTIGFHRINGQWKVVHEHASVPFDHETGKVAPITKPE